MKTTLDLPAALVRQVKLRAVMEDRSMKDLVADYIRQGLEMKVAEPEVPYASGNVVIAEDGMPVFRTTSPGECKIKNVEQALALEQQAILEEDLARVGLSHR